MHGARGASLTPYALISSLFRKFLQHFSDFIFQRAKKPSLHYQFDFRILGVLCVDTDTKKWLLQFQNNWLYIKSLGVSAIKALPHQAKVNALHIIHHDHDPALDSKTFACSACIIIAGTIIHAGTTEPALDANAAL
jgi:hypothetical protein